jgi:hypothetical protein
MLSIASIHSPDNIFTCFFNSLSRKRLRSLVPYPNNIPNYDAVGFLAGEHTPFFGIKHDMIPYCVKIYDECLS